MTDIMVIVVIVVIGTEQNMLIHNMRKMRGGAINIVRIMVEMVVGWNQQPRQKAQDEHPGSDAEKLQCAERVKPHHTIIPALSACLAAQTNPTTAALSIHTIATTTLSSDNPLVRKQSQQPVRIRSDLGLLPCSYPSIHDVG
ncbi:MAG: hypothetical protein ABR553_05060 [Gammaproteobacteria bacterium]